MGCAQSRIDNEESVARCKERKNLMKDAVVARNAFAAGHSGYAMALKNTGAALSDYGHGETHIDLELHPPPSLVAGTNPNPPPPPPPPPMEDNLPPPPPLPPNFSPASLKRSVTMPPAVAMPLRNPGVPAAITIAEEEEEEDKEEGKALKKGGAAGSPPEVKAVPPPMPESKNMAWDYFFMVENMPGPSLNGEDDEDENDEVIDGDDGEHVEDEVEPKTPEQVKVHVQEHEHEHEEITTEAKHIEHSKTAPAEFRRALKVAPTVTLMQILNSLDDHFLKASESAQEVSKMLEATRLHYHSNFADNRGIFLFLSI